LVVQPQGHWWRFFRRRILSTTPSGAKVTFSTSNLSIAMMRLNAVARTQFLRFCLFEGFRNYENYVRAT
jgi:hypothetical protein